MSLGTAAEEVIAELTRQGRPYAVAVVVRTVAATAAKAGAKAVFDEEGNLLAGWIGGGCATGATRKAAKSAIHEHRPILLSVRPEDLLDDGVAPGDERDGVTFARSMCRAEGPWTSSSSPSGQGPVWK